MTTTTETRTRTITLTGRHLVRIRENEWPVIAEASWASHDNTYEFQANRRADAQVKVRRHEDGRHLVYGIYRYLSNWQGERDVHAAAGGLLAPGDDVTAAIRKTVASLSSYESLPERERWQPDWRMLADDVIADLPAEQI